MMNKQILKSILKITLVVIIYLFSSYLFWQLGQIISFDNNNLSYLFTALGSVVGVLIIRLLFKNKFSFILDKSITWQNAILSIIIGITANCFIGTLCEVVICHKDISENVIFPTFEMLLYSIIVAPFAEGYIFRKNSIDLANSQVTKQIIFVLYSSLLFAAVHDLTNISYTMITFLSGIVYSYVYIKTSNFLYPILAHSAFNIMSAIDSVLHINKIYITRNIYVMIITGIIFAICILTIRNRNTRTL